MELGNYSYNLEVQVPGRHIKIALEREVLKALPINKPLRSVILITTSLLIALAQFLSASPPAKAGNSYAANSDESSALLSLGEKKLVLDSANAQIEDLRVSVGRMHIQLAQPYLLRGEAQLALNQAPQAVESFQTALHVLRVNHGLNSPEQLDALYRVSEAYVELGDYQRANETQERAYALMLAQMGPNNPELLPSLLKLIDWYESNRRYRAAKVLYVQAKDLAHSVFPSDDKRHIDLKRAFAVGMRNANYPPMDAENEFRAFDVNVPGADQPVTAIRPPSSYTLGYGALKSIVELLQSQSTTDERELITAKLNLADWHQLYGRETRAIQIYREIWRDLENMQTQRTRLFAEPKLLYIRLPEYKDDDKESGLVELLLTISNRGAVTGRISQLVDPKDSTVEFHTRIAARAARFRPAFRDGKPVTTKGVLLTHRYPLAKSQG